MPFLMRAERQPSPRLATRPLRSSRCRMGVYYADFGLAASGDISGEYAWGVKRLQARYGIT